MAKAPIAIAIDGPASSGKGTVARLVAGALGYSYVDTGAMYRCVGLLGQRRGLEPSDGPGLAAMIAKLRFQISWLDGRLQVVVDGEDLSTAIRTESVGQLASAVATLPEVRAALLELQRSLGAAGGVVMDGRDIGTVILPNAALKVFLDASAEVRAQRRQLELAQRGVAVSAAQVLQELQARDAQDANRATAPLRAADDAVHVDSSVLTPQEVADQVVALAHQRGA